MPQVFQYEHTVDSDEIDGQGHANNIAYLRWMQDLAVAHSSAQGWTGENYRQRGWAWVVRSHFIQYRLLAFLGDQLTLRTWVADMKKYTSLRKYEMRRGEQVIARAETNWAFVDITNQQLMAIPEDVSRDFNIVTDR